MMKHFFATLLALSVSTCGTLAPAIPAELSHDAWAVTVAARADGHLSPSFYSLALFDTKAACDEFRAGKEWKAFYLAWAEDEIKMHEGKIDFGPAPYCAQLKTIEPYADAGERA